MADITLSSRVRSNLLSLQNTSDLMTLTQGRLATGKKVNSALDNPGAYFTAQGLSDRAKSLGDLLDGMSNALQTVNAANTGANTITTLLKQAQSIAQQAKTAGSTSTNTIQGTAALTGGSGSNPQAIALSTLLTNASAGLTSGDTLTFTSTTSSGVKTSFDFSVTGTSTVQDLVTAINNSGVATASVDGNGTLKLTSGGSLSINVTSGGTTAALTAGTLGLPSATSTQTTGGNSVDYAAQFNDLVDQINKAAGDASFNGVNLLAAGSNNSLTVTFDRDSGSSLTIQNTDLSATTLGLTSQTSVNNSNAQSLLNTISSALASVKSFQAGLGNKQAILQARQDFTKNLVSTLNTGSDTLTNADMNAEGANLLALQTRQQLSQTALSLSNQADQAVLRLFG